MRRPRMLLAASLVACVATLGGVPAPAGATPTVSFTLLTPLPSELSVGESAVIGVRVDSTEEFAMAIALSNSYYGSER